MSNHGPDNMLHFDAADVTGKEYLTRTEYTKAFGAYPLELECLHPWNLSISVDSSISEYLLLWHVLCLRIGSYLMALMD